MQEKLPLPYIPDQTGLEDHHQVKEFSVAGKVEDPGKGGAPLKDSVVLEAQVALAYFLEVLPY